MANVLGTRIGVVVVPYCYLFHCTSHELAADSVGALIQVPSPPRASPEAFWGSRKCALPPGQNSGEEHCRKLSHICEQAFTKPCNGQFKTVHINPKIFLSFLWIEVWTTFYSATKHTSESLVSTSSIHVHLKVFKSWWSTVAGFLFPIAITEGCYGNTQGNTSSLLFVDDLSLNAGYPLCCFG